MDTMEVTGEHFVPFVMHLCRAGRLASIDVWSEQA